MRRSFLRSASLLLPLFTLAAAPDAAAQTPAPTPPPATAPAPAPTPQVRPGDVAVPAGTPVPAQNAPVTTTGSGATQALPLPTVNDPMLEPVPPPEQVISTWQEALSLVKSRSTDLRFAYDEVQRAVAAQRVALAGALFTLNASANASKQLITNRLPSQTVYTLTDNNGNVVGSPSFSPNNGLNYGPVTYPSAGRTPNPDVVGVGSITISQPILALRAWHQIGTAEENTKAFNLSLEDEKRILALNVANALVGVITSERIAEINREGLRQALARLDLTERKQRLGAATGLDVVRAQQDVESARNQLVAGDETLRKNRESLGLAVGIPTQVGVARDIRIENLERDAIGACRPAPSIDDRTDVAAARKHVEVADRNIDDVWLQFAPTANLGSTLATTTVDTGVAPPTTWSITGVISFPLWEGGARYGLLHDARAVADEARQNLEASRRNASIQVEQARRAVTVAADTLAVQARSRDLAVKNDELTQTAYRGGTLTSLDLVTAATLRRQAEIQYALDEFDLVQARVAAILALATCDW